MEFKILLRETRVCLARYDLDSDQYDGERLLVVSSLMLHLEEYAQNLAEFTGFELIDCR